MPSFLSVAHALRQSIASNAATKSATATAVAPDTKVDSENSHQEGHATDAVDPKIKKDLEEKSEFESQQQSALNSELLAKIPLQEKDVLVRDLQNAIGSNNAEKIQSLLYALPALERQPVLQYALEMAYLDGKLLLHRAVENKQVDTLKMLIKSMQPENQAGFLKYMLQMTNPIDEREGQSVFIRYAAQLSKPARESVMDLALRCGHAGLLEKLVDDRKDFLHIFETEREFSQRTALVRSLKNALVRNNVEDMQRRLAVPDSKRKDLLLDALRMAYSERIPVLHGAVAFNNSVWLQALVNAVPQEEQVDFLKNILQMAGQSGETLLQQALRRNDALLQALLIPLPLEQQMALSQTVAAAMHMDPLPFAAKFGLARLVELLIQQAQPSLAGEGEVKSDDA